ncbi:sensor histidine kinase [Longimicrobium terrae]|uniref:histidine kinase n=1 Tax=Longimicrobium terrae TaxID=1639882 RepID=A0A841H5B7_9BACT|nr:HAMP domain-containing sensor histidine kinase [Longimicrobium terrae]MBB4638929.1 signal transduction histidine kinase [Longimicrobium terrae]MBB6073168.1 signal transduction histidine kinase [Longimicrobium terrae]NNC30146.1 HAMP domain-containing histidine kinase [Longimicrobium terrae]
MTREEAFDALNSSSMHERLKGARHLRHTAQRDDFPKLTAALSVESVVWVRRALEQALETAGVKTAPNAISSRIWDDVEPEDEAYARAVEDTTRRLVHELQPIVGILRLHATLEVPDFGNSRTYSALFRLADTIEAVSVLAKVARVPQAREFDLADLIRSVSESEAFSAQAAVEFAGIAPLMAVSDPTILSIVIANGIRNAIEATLAGGRSHLPVVVNWGSTPKEYWFSIIDHGVGLPLSAGRVYEIGTTTKSEHLGMGLAICYRAARTLGGEIVLNRREEVGAAFHFRWPRPFTER